MPLSPESPPPAGDLAPLLNQAVLRLSPDLRTAELSADRLAVKYVPGRRYLVLTPQQWALLQEFGPGRTVTQVLCAVISAQRCPSLREFYELVVKAVRAGILQADVTPPPPAVAPAKWALRLNGALLRWTTLVFGLGAVVCLLRRPVYLPQHPAWLALGWLAVCAAASAGWALAAGVVRAAGGEVYHPRFAWKTFAPRFIADLDDGLMCGRAARINAALARLAPLFLFAALAAWRLPELLVPALAGVLLQLSPLWPSPLQELLAVFYRDPQLTTSYDFVFAQDRLFALLGRARRQMADGKYLLACAAGTVVWLLVVFLGGCVLLQTNATELLQRFNAAGGWRYTALGLLVCAGLVVAVSVGAAAWIVFRHVRAWARERAERKLRPSAVLVSPETIAQWLGRTMLFRELAAADLAALAAAVKPEEHKRGSYVVREGEPGARLYLVLSGRLEVRRDYAPGKSEPVAGMGEGDAFGEIALLQGGVRTRSVRALGKSILLGLDKTDFERLVLSKLSRAAVEDAVQKVGFLQHLELTRNWSQPTLAAFARRTKLLEYAEGALVVQEGANNHWFFLVHRGEFAVTKGKEELRRLHPGDSFGEMSLLGDGIATATVTVRSRVASCLVISGRDFLDFMTRDFTVGLGWEDARLHPVKR
ncbi:cyclic nucleotide-binding domain-containing protein [Opitutus sp. GAS368]|jgi:CRP-like cAMP-binding protein|uniref:cyclic nucleotide-binding domain-containing protein n=1 Tax=Opitutus sp. GAS368 TaxID=1882749 RepID=UPI00087DD6A6|nr:cyclic nucleotide-binding domain-containing protein [Opitutus sp. GAS368]SDR66012.1 Cyclic nucleotide-binding domain-containing protein [Opitutus sp. GAS368]